MTFEIKNKELEELNKWKELIKELYGEYGLYTYKFTPNGIGDSLVVYSHLAKIEKEFTDLDSW